MLCQSHKGTLNMVDAIAKDYDRLPRSWRDNLIRFIQPEQSQVCFAVCAIGTLSYIYH